MITDEQIQKLKPGDPLIIHGTFNRIYEDGDICVTVKATAAFCDEVLPDSMYVHPSCVSMPPEKPIEMFHITKIPEVYLKYDPCRLFKAGDVVEYRPKDGRANPNFLVGRHYKVSADEPCDSGIVQVEFDGLRHLNTFVAYNNLQLVTPVEDIKQFYLESDNHSVFYIFFGTKQNYELVSRLDKKYYSLTDAIAECDRLNAEYRKERENA